MSADKQSHINLRFTSHIFCEKEFQDKRWCVAEMNTKIATWQQTLMRRFSRNACLMVLYPHTYLIQLPCFLFCWKWNNIFANGEPGWQVVIALYVVLVPFLPRLLFFTRLPSMCVHPVARWETWCSEYIWTCIRWIVHRFVVLFSHDLHAIKDSQKSYSVPHSPLAVKRNLQTEVSLGAAGVCTKPTRKHSGHTYFAWGAKRANP